MFQNVSAGEGWSWDSQLLSTHYSLKQVRRSKYARKKLKVSGPEPAPSWLRNRPQSPHLSTQLQAGPFSAQKPLMTPLSLWTKASFTICSQPPCPASSHTHLLEIASNMMPWAHQVICRFLNTPCAFVEPWFLAVLLSGLSPHRCLSFSSLNRSSLIATSSLKHSLRASSPPHAVLLALITPPARIHLFFKERY